LLEQRIEGECAPKNDGIVDFYEKCAGRYGCWQWWIRSKISQSITFKAQRSRNEAIQEQTANFDFLLQSVLLNDWWKRQAKFYKEGIWDGQRETKAGSPDWSTRDVGIQEIGTVTG